MSVTPADRPLLALLAALAMLLLLPVAAVRAHAELDTATPGPDQTVDGSPAELVATFTEPLDPDETSLVVIDAAGAEVAAGGEPGSAPELWRLTLPELTPGVYEVRWTASSTVDSHLERGTYTFTVTAAPTPPPTPEPTPTREPSATAEPTPSPSPSPSPTAPPSPSPSAVAQPPSDPAADASVLLPIVAVVVLVGGLGAWLLRGRRRSA